MTRWTLDEAVTAIKAANGVLPGWRIALHGSVLHYGDGRDLDLLVLPFNAAPATQLALAMNATEIVTRRPDKLRFLLADGKIVDARIVKP